MNQIEFHVAAMIFTTVVGIVTLLVSVFVLSFISPNFILTGIIAAIVTTIVCVSTLMTLLEQGKKAGA